MNAESMRAKAYERNAMYAKAAYESFPDGSGEKLMCEAAYAAYCALSEPLLWNELGPFKKGSGWDLACTESVCGSSVPAREVNNLLSLLVDDVTAAGEEPVALLACVGDTETKIVPVSTLDYINMVDDEALASSTVPFEDFLKFFPETEMSEALEVFGDKVWSFTRRHI